MYLEVHNQTRQKLLAKEAAEARAFGARLKGLLGRTDFPMGQGLHIVPCNSIHTFFMKLPIDVLMLDADYKVVRLWASLPPWRVTPVVPRAKSVLELPSGVVAASGTQEGDQLVFQEGILRL